MTSVLVASALAVTLYMTAAWLLSLRLRDASIADVFWGPGFALVAILSALISAPSARAALLAVLPAAFACCRGCRLGRRRPTGHRGPCR